MLKTLSCLFLLSTPAIAGALDEPVVGGQPAKAGAWPDVVVVRGPTARCTGTLIAPDLVLTAGHCIEIKPTEIEADTLDANKPGETIPIKAATAYPDWQHKYDVGILELAHPAKGKPREIAGSCTVHKHLKAGALVQVVGFGLTDKAGMGSNSLLEQATMPIVDPTCKNDPACNKAINPNGEFTAGGKGTSSCFGDSGGPVFADALKGAALLGVVSRGISAGSGEPCGGASVDVRADRVVKWIEKTTHRKLQRSTCSKKQDEAADGEDANVVTDDEQQGGCAAAGGANVGALVALGATLFAARRRRRRS